MMSRLASISGFEREIESSGACIASFEVKM